MSWAQRTDSRLKQTSNKDNVMTVSHLTLRETLPPQSSKKLVTPQPEKIPLPKLYEKSPEPKKDYMSQFPFHGKINGYGCRGCGSGDHLLYACPIYGDKVRKDQKRIQLTLKQQFDRIFDDHSSSSDEDEIKDCKVCGKGNHWTHKCSIWLEQERVKAREEKTRREKLAEEDKKWMDNNLLDCIRIIANPTQIRTFISNLPYNAKFSVHTLTGLSYEFSYYNGLSDVYISPVDDRLKRTLGSGMGLDKFMDVLKSKNFSNISVTTKPRITIKDITLELSGRGILSYCCNDTKERYHEYRYKNVTYVQATSDYYDSGERTYYAQASIEDIISLYNKYATKKVTKEDLTSAFKVIPIKTVH